MKFVPVVLSALILAIIWPPSSESSSRSPRQLRVPLPLPTLRPPPAGSPPARTAPAGTTPVRTAPAGTSPARTPLVRTPPEDRRRSPLFPKMGASFVVTERARKMAPQNKMAPNEVGKKRTNALLPNLRLKQRIAGEGNVKRMTGVSPGVAARPVVIRPSNLVKTSMTATMASRLPTPPAGQSTTKRALMRPASQLMGGAVRGTRTRDVTGASRPLIREKKVIAQPLQLPSSPPATRDMPSGLAYRD